MRALICAGIVCACVAYATSTWADARADSRATYRRAAQLVDRGDAEAALAVIDAGLAAAPRNLSLLGLKGMVLMSLYDYAGAFATYQAYLDAGARGANRREVQKIVNNLRAVQSTHLEVTVANGPAAIFLDSTARRPICAAVPPCIQAVLPGSYKVIAERAGFVRWTGPVTIVGGETTKLAVTLVEKPSVLTVRVAQPGARVTVDDTAYTTPTTVPAGVHRVVVSLSGHVTHRLEATARQGAAIDLDVALAPLVAVRVSPPHARLALDGTSIAFEDGGIAVPPGRHVLVASAPGFGDRRVEIPAIRADGYHIVVELARPRQDVAPPAAARWLTRRNVAIAASGVGLAALASGVALGIQSRRLDHDTYALCPPASRSCGAAQEANELNRRARSRALEANIGFGIAGGAAIAAAVLWFTAAPESRVVVVPHLGAPRDVAGLDLAVRF